MSYMIKNVDRLSNLPEEVHSHILSLMPTKFAVRTSILSRRWRYRWTLVTNLDFDDSHPFQDLDCFSKFVDRVLELLKSPQVKLFRMWFSEMWVKKSNVSKWIDAAVRLKVSELDVQAILLELPLCLFTCRTLTKLTLAHNTRYWDVWECSSPVNLPFLKTLDVTVFTNPFVNAFKLICGCPMLENLSLQVFYCKGEEDYIFNIPTLKRLKLTWVKYQFVTQKVVFNTPNLEYLFIGPMEGSLFVVEELSLLVEASVSFHSRSFKSITFDHMLIEFLKRISGVKSLSIQTTIPFTSPLPIFPNMKHLKLKGILHSGQILEFLKSSPELKHLCIEKGSEIFFSEKEKPEDSHWIEPKSVPACMLTSLTTIEFSDGKKCDIGLLEYMLVNAEVLKTVTITLYVCIDEETRLREQLLNFPRASRCCELHIELHILESSPSTSSNFLIL